MKKESLVAVLSSAVLLLAAHSAYAYVNIGTANIDVDSSCANSHGVKFHLQYESTNPDSFPLVGIYNDNKNYQLNPGNVSLVEGKNSIQLAIGVTPKQKESGQVAFSLVCNRRGAGVSDHGHFATFNVGVSLYGLSANSATSTGLKVSDFKTFKTWGSSVACSESHGWFLINANDDGNTISLTCEAAS